MVEGRLGKVSVVGNARARSEWLEAYLRAKSGQVLRYSDIQRDLRRMNQNPSREVRATLAPGAEPGSSDLVLNVKENRPYRFGYSVDNHGTRLSGRVRQGLQYQQSDLLGRDDVLYNSFLISERADLVGDSISYVLPVSPNGGRFIFSYAYSKVELGKELKALDVDGDAHLASVGYGQTVLEGSYWTLDLNGAFELKEIKSTINDEENSHDRLRIVRFGPAVNVRDAWGSTSIRNDFVFGIPDFLGADDESFFVDELSVNRLQPFVAGSVLTGRFDAQWTDDSLVSAQQFRAGGYDTVRGYAEGDSLGDSGYLLSGEWRFPPYFIPESCRVPWRQETWRESLQWLLFADFASLDRRAVAPGQDDNRELAGAGFGARFELRDGLNFQVDCGWPIGDPPAEGRKARVHFGLNVPF